MAYLQFTQKALKALGLNPVAINETEAEGTGCLGSWHVNLLYIEEKKCLLFVNNHVLINFLVVGVKKSDGAQIGKLFQEHLTKLLILLEIESPKIFGVLSEYNDVGIAKTSSRSVLGTLNDLAFHYPFHVERDGGLKSCSIDRIALSMNDMPMRCSSKQQSLFPNQALKELVDS